MTGPESGEARPAVIKTPLLAQANSVVPIDADRLFPMLANMGHQIPKRSVDLKAEKSKYSVGEEMHLTITSPISGYLSLLSADAGESSPTVLAENMQVASGKSFVFPTQDLLTLKAALPLGTMRVVAVVTADRYGWTGVLKSGVRETNLANTFAASPVLSLAVVAP